MEHSKKDINYLLLIAIVIGLIFINTFITTAILRWLNRDEFLAVTSVLSLLLLVSGISILQKSGNRTIGWALVCSGLASILVPFLLIYGISQLYSV